MGGVVVQGNLAFRSWQASWGLVIVECVISGFLCICMAEEVGKVLGEFEVEASGFPGFR